MDSLTTEQMIEGYFLATTKAVGTLFREELYGHTLVVIYSTIDTCGLLDAPPSQTSASGGSFKSWVKKYLLIQAGIEFNETDLWGARCSILHTFTSESDLSKAGKAHELLYYSGDKSSAQAKQLISFAKKHEGGRYLPVHYGDLCEAFFQAIKAFVPDLDANCSSNPTYNGRLRKIMQVHPYGPAS